MGNRIRLALCLVSFLVEAARALQSGAAGYHGQPSFHKNPPGVPEVDQQGQNCQSGYRDQGQAPWRYGEGPGEGSLHRTRETRPPPVAPRPADEPEPPPLPEGWGELRTEDGRPYYVHYPSGVVQWERPMPPSTGDKVGVDGGGIEGQGVEERRAEERESPGEVKDGADQANELEESSMEKDEEGAAARMVHGSPSGPRELEASDNRLQESDTVEASVENAPLARSGPENPSVPSMPSSQEVVYDLSRYTSDPGGASAAMEGRHDDPPPESALEMSEADQDQARFPAYAPGAMAHAAPGSPSSLGYPPRESPGRRESPLEKSSPGSAGDVTGGYPYPPGSQLPPPRRDDDVRWPPAWEGESPRSTGIYNPMQQHQPPAVHTEQASGRTGMEGPWDGKELGGSGRGPREPGADGSHSDRFEGSGGEGRNDPPRASFQAGYDSRWPSEVYNAEPPVRSPGVPITGSTGQLPTKAGGFPGGQPQPQSQQPRHAYPSHPRDNQSPPPQYTSAGGDAPTPFNQGFPPQGRSVYEPRGSERWAATAVPDQGSAIPGGANWDQGPRSGYHGQDPSPPPGMNAAPGAGGPAWGRDYPEGNYFVGETSGYEPSGAQDRDDGRGSGRLEGAYAQNVEGYYGRDGVYQEDPGRSVSGSQESVKWDEYGNFPLGSRALTPYQRGPPGGTSRVREQGLQLVRGAWDRVLTGTGRTRAVLSSARERATLVASTAGTTFRSTVGTMTSRMADALEGKPEGITPYGDQSPQGYYESPPETTTPGYGPGAGYSWGASGQDRFSAPSARPGEFQGSPPSYRVGGQDHDSGYRQGGQGYEGRGSYRGEFYGERERGPVRGPEQGYPERTGGYPGGGDGGRGTGSAYPEQQRGFVPPNVGTRQGAPWPGGQVDGGVDGGSFGTSKPPYGTGGQPSRPSQPPSEPQKQRQQFERPPPGGGTGADGGYWYLML